MALGNKGALCSVSKGTQRGFGTREVGERPGPPHLCRLLDRQANGFLRNVESAVGVTDLQSNTHLSGALVKTK